MTINIQNESSLHKQLKQLYSLDDGYHTEVQIGKWICDILSVDGTVIEIQTANLSKLLPKANDFLAQGMKLKIVYPLVTKKYIELYTETDVLLHRRVSPKKQCIYDVFKELTGLYPVLLNKNFTLEIPEIVLCEKRTSTSSPVQTKNKKRRFLRNWYKSDKKLESIETTYSFSTARDYLNLLPSTIAQNFSAKTLSEALLKNKNIPPQAAKNAYIMLWVLVRMNLIKKTKREKRTQFYAIVG